MRPVMNENGCLGGLNALDGSGVQILKAPCATAHFVAHNICTYDPKSRLYEQRHKLVSFDKVADFGWRIAHHANSLGRRRVDIL